MSILKELPSGTAKERAVRDMFDAIAARYDFVNRIMSLGLDRGWRRRAITELRLPPRSRVLDVACGTGDLCNLLQRSHMRAVGIDLSAGMLAAARTTAPLVQGNALAMPLASGSLDGIVSGFGLRNVTDLHRLFFEIARVVRPGGRVVLLEVAEPRSRVVRAGHSLYFRKMVPIIGGLLSDRDAYDYLPRSTAYLPEPGELVTMLAAAGFEEIKRTLLWPGAAQIVAGTRLR